MSTARRVAIVLVLVGGIALAGCTLSSQSSEYPAEDEVRDQLTSLETLEATVVSETTGVGNRTSTEMHVVRNFETGGFRMLVTSGPSSGTTIVSNGTRIWYYQSRSNTVQVVENPSTIRSVNRTVRMVSRIYERLDDADGGSSDQPIGISPAPTVPAASQQASTSGQPLTLPVGENVSVSDAGTASVDGREARVVELDASASSGPFEDATYWFDREWHFPLRTRVGVRIDNDTTGSVTTYRNVSFNEPVDDVQFTFDPPATARVVAGLNESPRTFESREAIASATERSVPDPAMPSGYRFESGQLAPVGAGQTTTMIYAGESGTITITELAGTTSEPSEAGESMQIAGRSGRERSIGRSHAIVWTCGGSTYSVIGPGEGVPLREIAASMACE